MLDPALKLYRLAIAGHGLLLNVTARGPRIIINLQLTAADEGKRLRLNLSRTQAALLQNALAHVLAHGEPTP